MTDLKLACDCGKVTLTAHNVSPRLGNRLVCYCESCQQFPIKLGKQDSVLDEYGGTEIYQMPPAQLEITGGREHVRCMRHTKEGLFRFYAGCCNSPIANSPGLGLPLVGLIHSNDLEPGRRDERLGPIRAHVNLDGATKPLPKERRKGFVLVILRILAQMMLWRIRKKVHPHPFFDREGRAIVKPEVR